MKIHTLSKLIVLILLLNFFPGFSQNQDSIISKNNRKAVTDKNKFLSFYHQRTLSKANLNKFLTHKSKFRNIQEPVQPKSNPPLSSLTALPANIIVPAEFEESQAVFISWPSDAYDTQGNYIAPFTGGKGFYYDDNGDILTDNYGNIIFGDVGGYETDLSYDSPYPVVWKQMVDAIQRECPVWIRLSNP